MKILVVSDTHRQVNKVITVLHNTPDITNVIHLGDYVRDADEIQEVFPDKVYHKIQGNNDMLSFAKPDMLLSLCGYNIFATHGHAYGVKRGSFALLAKRAIEMGCDMALFGHTHEYADETLCGVRCLNPSNKGYFIITEENIEFFEY